MKAIYAFSALVLLASCQSTTPPQNEQTASQTVGSDSSRYFSIPFGNDLAGRGLKGAYEIYSDSTEQHFGHSTLTIKSIKPEELASLTNNLKPEQCIGKRVEYTAWVKTKDVTGRAALWLRIDPADPHKPTLGFDNMRHRPIMGTQDWTVYHVVLDVPEGAANMFYGALLHGDGQIWVDSMTVKIVDKSVPTTENLGRKTL